MYEILNTLEDKDDADKVFEVMRGLANRIDGGYAQAGKHGHVETWMNYLKSKVYIDYFKKFFVDKDYNALTVMGGEGETINLVDRYIPRIVSLILDYEELKDNKIYTTDFTKSDPDREVPDSDGFLIVDTLKMYLIAFREFSNSQLAVYDLFEGFRASGSTPMTTDVVNYLADRIIGSWIRGFSLFAEQE